MPGIDSETDAFIEVETPAEFRFRSTLLSHGWLQLAPFRHDPSFTELRRVERLADGRIVELVFSAAADEAIRVELERLDGSLTEAVRDEARRLTRRIFNLDIDLQPFYAALEGEARYRWVQHYGAGRLLRAPTVWEDLAKTLLTTNTTWAMTRQMVGRLVDLGAAGDQDGSFPPPERIAALPFEELAEKVRAGYRNEYLHKLARDIVEGTVPAERWADADASTADLYDEVRSLRGFGPYAAGSVLKLLGRFDYLAVDSAARSMFAADFSEGRAPSKGDILSHYERFGEWKGLVLWMDLMKRWFPAEPPGDEPAPPIS